MAEATVHIKIADMPEVKAAILLASERLEAADNLAQKVEWAYNDACFTAPEDRERMNRQWGVMMDALREYREAASSSHGGT